MARVVSRDVDAGGFDADADNQCQRRRRPRLTPCVDAADGEVSRKQ